MCNEIHYVDENQTQTRATPPSGTVNDVEEYLKKKEAHLYAITTFVHLFMNNKINLTLF